MRKAGIVALCVGGCHAALNIDPHTPEAMAEKLRHQIFIDAAFLAKRDVGRCSSLDGPACLAMHAAGTRPRASGSRGVGVLPEALWHDFGAQQPGDAAHAGGAEYHVLRAYQQGLVEQADASGGLGPSAVAELRNSTRQGVLSFAGLEAERRVTLSYSRGLPSGIVATWDGRWLSRGLAGVAGDFGALPDPEEENECEGYSVPMVASDAVGTAGGVTPNRRLESAATAVVEQASSVAYVRFSHPVVVRALVARWSPADGAPSALVSGRLGLENVWATHLDPAGLREHGWSDISGGSLQLVDEIAFIGTNGLELGGMWIAVNTAETSEVPVMVIEPDLTGSTPPKFIFRRRSLPPAALPFVFSVSEALDEGLKLESDPFRWALPHSHGASSRYPAILSTEMSAALPWPKRMVENQHMLEHQWLPTASHPEELTTAAASALSYLRVLSLGTPSLPPDVKTALGRDGPKLQQGLEAWISGVTSGWPRIKNAGWSRISNAQEAREFRHAKLAQNQLDVLVAAFLHRRP